ncbi:CENP-S associating centromere protein X-domain-containing protein [Xylariaceae sp. FL0804]|nr:CENP-S associating centromere protein X-domain-containing protein [Xylariaceae sp. FL0804]
MPPKQPTGAPRGRPPKSRPSATGLKAAKTTAAASSSASASASAKRARAANRTSAATTDDPFADDNDDDDERLQQQRMDVDRDDNENEDEDEEEEEEEEAAKTIPPELLTRLLHEFFEREGTRVSRDANKAVAKYMDVFVREAIARAAVEKESGFLEVEDLEKVAPQLLLDL